MSTKEAEQTPRSSRLRQWLEIDKPNRTVKPTDQPYSLPKAESSGRLIGGRGRQPEYFISVLRVCAGICFWVCLIAGALLMLSSLGGAGWYFFLGVGVIFEGFVFYALLNVFGLIVENLIAIRKSLQSMDKDSDPLGNDQE